MELSNILNLMNDTFNEKEKEQLKRIIEDYTYGLKEELLNEDPIVARNILLSEYNHKVRSQLKSCKLFGMTIEEGDIVYADFGKAYILEMGYQHFGVVVKVYNAKALIIPMTSNMEAYHNAYDELINPNGLSHLMKIGRQQGCFKYSVLYLNDAKFINTARIINKKGHIDTESLLYKKIVDRLIQIIQLEP